MPVIRAYYESMSDAGKAAKELNKLGHRAYLDMMERFSEEYSSSLDVFTSCSPVGGCSSGADERYFNTSLLVTVDKDKMNEVKKYIQEQGGTIL